MSGTVAYGIPLRIQEVKASGDAWEVAGYASTFGNVDLGGDVVLRGAFAETLKADAPVRFLYSHNPADVLGVPLALKEDERGLFGRFRISKTRLGEDVHTLLKDGALDSFSIGYIPTDFEYDDAGVRKLAAVELLEVSVVAMPMNPEAVVTGVKAADYSQFSLEKIVEVLSEHRAAALAAAKALAERRRSEGRKLSDRAMELLEALRAASQEDADALLALLTAPPPERKAQPEPEPDEAAAEPTTDPEPSTAAVRTAGLVEAHLRRARIKRLRAKFADVPLPEYDAVAHLERLVIPGEDAA